MTLREEADFIIKYAIKNVLPDNAVKRALRKKTFETGNLYVVSIGKAAWQMAKAAEEILGEKIKKGIVVTKYGHVKGGIPRCMCFEGGHPIPDENSYLGTQKALAMISNLEKEDTVLFLLSGGGSALFEKPLISGKELSDITEQLLYAGADIVEINTIRKRLSAVKGGRFAKFCEPAKIYNIVLSDIIGNPMDMIASGPSYPDTSTCEMALKTAKKYSLKLSRQAWECLRNETPKKLENVETVITGSVCELCKAVEDAARQLGYVTCILTDQLDCEAKEAGAFLAAIAGRYQNSKKSLCFIAGGETVVHVTGKGKGGRNQELVLSAAPKIQGFSNTAIFSIGSDGTDGPTDAAGGYCDGKTGSYLKEQGIDVYRELLDNNAYYALEKTNSLIKLGATGTNVNDVAVLLIKRENGF